MLKCVHFVNYYLPTKLREGNVFTGVFLSGGGVGLGPRSLPGGGRYLGEGARFTCGGGGEELGIPRRGRYTSIPEISSDIYTVLVIIP